MKDLVLKDSTQKGLNKILLADLLTFFNGNVSNSCVNVGWKAGWLGRLFVSYLIG